MNDVRSCDCTEIRIGRTAENDARVVRFNVSDWQGIYGPGGAFILMHQRPNDDEPYICQASVAEDGWLEWVVQAPDLARTGRGQLQLSYVVGETTAKSMIFTTRISRSLDQNDELPEPYENMIEELIQAAADIVIVGQQVQTAKEAADADVLKAEGHAIGKQNGEDVPSDSPYYHNNAKYYSEQAGASATQAGLSEQQAGSSAGAAASDALKAEGHAIGKQNGENVPSDSPYYHNNAKYYSEQAGASATQAGLSEQQAGSSAGAAAADALKAEGYAVGKQNGEDVPSDSPYYHNSAEYYKDQAAEEADRAEAAAEDAEEYAEDAAPAIINSASGSIASFSDGADNRKIRSLVVNIEPVQDLHGYDNPWPAGGYKNLILMTVENIKAINILGSWNGMVYTYNNVVFTVIVDNGGNIEGIKTEGIASAETDFYACGSKAYPAGTYILNGCPEGGSPSTFRIFGTNIGGDNGNGATGTVDGIKETSVRINIKSGTNTNGLVFKPMLRASNVSDSTFAPYSNICPIAGWTGCKIEKTGENLFNKNAPDINERHALSPSSGNEYISQNWDVSGFIKIKGGSKYISSGIGEANDVCFYDANKNYISGNSNFSNAITAPANAVYLKIDYKRTKVDTTQVEEGNSASPYKPFGTAISITFKDENNNTLTVFGGESEIIGGELKILKVCETATGSEDDSKYTFPIGSNYNLGAFQLSYGAKNDTGIFSQFKPTTKSYVNFVLGEAEVYSGKMAFYFTGEKTTAGMKAYIASLGGVQCCYELSTPITYTFTPTEIKTLLGINNIWADTGDIDSVDYVADTKLYIDNKITQMIASALNA